MSSIVATPDFETYRNALIAYIRAKPGFENYNFEGSTLNILADILAYNTQQNAFMINMAGSEMFMDTSLLRESIISHAQLLGYYPRSNKSAQASIRVTLTGNANSVVLIPKGFEFNGKGTAGQTLRFSTKESKTVTLSNAGTATVDLIILEGPLKQYKYSVSVSNAQKQILPIPQMDLSTVVVRVFASQSDVIGSTYFKFDSLFEINNETKVFWLYETLNNSYQLQFGDDNFGKKPVSGNIVTIDYVLSSGSAGNGAKQFSQKSTLTGVNMAIVTLTPGVGGANKESDEEIKNQAPLNYSIQNRAVTMNDYKILIKNFFSDISAISVWGGEDNKPVPYYGRVFFSIKPITKSRLSTLEINSIKSFLKERQVLTNQIEYTHPELIDVILNIKCWLKNNSITLGAVDSSIKLSVVNYGASDANDFNSELKYSKLVEAIDNASEVIDHNLTSIKLGYNLYANFNEPWPYTIEFDNALVPGSLYCDNVLYKNIASIIKDNELGQIAIYRSVSGTLTKVIDIGTIDYTTGLVTLPSFTPEYNGGDFVRFTCTPFEYSIKAQNNKLLNLLAENINVTFPEE